MVKLIIIFLIIVIIASGSIGYFISKLLEPVKFTKLQIKIDEKNNVYFIKQYFLNRKLIKTETVARISSDRNEFQVY